jgi:hypothetical protein
MAAGSDGPGGVTPFKCGRLGVTDQQTRIGDQRGRMPRSCRIQRRWRGRIVMGDAGRDSATQIERCHRSPLPTRVWIAVDRLSAMFLILTPVSGTYGKREWRRSTPPRHVE